MALEYLGDYDGWTLYRNSDGFVEGLRSTGMYKLNGIKYYKDSKRLITNQTTPQGFLDYLKGLRPGKKVKDIPLKPSQLPTLFPGEQ